MNENMKEENKPVFPIKTGLSQKGSPKAEVKGFLFDIYGTLFISRSGDISLAQKGSQINDEITELINRFEIKTEPEILLKSFFSAVKNKHEELKNKGVDYPEVEIDMIWKSVLDTNDTDLAGKFAEEYEAAVNPVYPMPNLDKLLSVCREKDIPMGIISNAQFYTPIMFKKFLGHLPEELGMDSELVIYSYKHGYAKPSMFLFELAKERLAGKGIETGNVVYIGNDMLNDIYPACKTCFQTALFAGDARSLRERKNNPLCSDISPDMVITDLIQLADFI